MVYIPPAKPFNALQEGSADVWHVFLILGLRHMWGCFFPPFPVLLGSFHCLFL
jgi:hypothetical protein